MASSEIAPTAQTSTLTVQPATAAVPLRPIRKDPQQRVVQIRNLQHYYGHGELRKQVLFDCNLDVNAGEIVIMTGPSGSGKTTLLTLIGALRSAHEGQLSVLGHELCGATSEELIAVRRKLGFIFQAHNLFASLTAVQNVKMALELFDGAFDLHEEKAIEMLTAVGLEKHVRKKPAKLSGGQKQRVAIARGLVHRPRIILADEPTAALDASSGRTVVELFQRMVKELGCTVLMVTHDNRILDVADRIVSLVDGRIKSDVVVGESAIICDFLQQSRLFSSLTIRTLTTIADKMRSAQFDAGATVIRQNETGDLFYLIREGSVDVVVNDGFHDKVIATLEQGNFFGEAALLTGNPRNATVIAREPSVFYTLDKASFLDAMQCSDSLQQEVRKALFSRQ